MLPRLSMTMCIVVLLQFVVIYYIGNDTSTSNTSAWLAGCTADQPDSESSRCGVHTTKKHQNSIERTKTTHVTRMAAIQYGASHLFLTNCDRKFLKVNNRLWARVDRERAV